ncbi:hypothetical protein EVAR_67851_1 [Eumeta japonica]|uniref:Uncharacterized protein n=1 Tax=Eumeta variegata TaxID=151549 RepID=A0A4C1SFL7_EUMVA|nr:hypothetical protein EVAR_67851_1 [Eumeta japonica]
MGVLVNELPTEFDLNQTLCISGSTLSHRSWTVSPRQQPFLQPALHGGRNTYGSRALGDIYWGDVHTMHPFPKQLTTLSTTHTSVCVCVCACVLEGNRKSGKVER